MSNFTRYGIERARLLLPDAACDMTKWSVIACDQHTSNPAYWDRVKANAGEAPSTLKLIFPEVYLGSTPPDIAGIHARMEAYKKDVLTRAVEGFVLVERQTTCGNRLGLVVALDLEQYDYASEARPLIRCTEGTVVERIPPRMAIRQGAPLELSHVMVLADDKELTLIEPLYAKRGALEKLYDFDLMEGGGHIRGWAVTDERDLEALQGALDRLYEAADGFLFAVGDGNHSLATAKACWEKLKGELPPEQLEGHSARFAMVELVNLYDPSLVFEPIHRAVFGADEKALRADFAAYLEERGMALSPCAEKEADLFIQDEPLRIERAVNPLPVAIFQPFLDAWLKAHAGASVDYIHGLNDLNSLDAVHVRLTAMDKRDLFPAVRAGGALPRKTFSMGEAQDKRYYTECRAIR